MTDGSDDAPDLHHDPSGETRQVLHRILAAQHATNRHLSRLEHMMTDLNAALTDLTAAVQTAVADLGGGVAALQAQLAQAQSDLAALQVQDDADKAALAQSIADSQAAADTIETQVSALNAATGSTPPTT